MSYPPQPPPYNPTNPQPNAGVCFEQYQQGTPYPPPPYSSPYPQQQYGGPPTQQGYPPQQGFQQPYGQPQYVYTNQPKTVYVYDQSGRRRQDNSDAADCFLLGLCAACLCCCVLD